MKGFKGPCPMMNLKYFDLASGFVPDFLHYSQGVVEQHLNLLLAMLTDDDIEEISRRILKLATPSAVTRNPRPLKDREKFKASEWRALLVLYGPVVMKDIVPDKYLNHFCLLSCAMHILLQKSITLQQLKFCDDLIVLYCLKYQEYFGVENMTYNIHLLLHVVAAVLNHGPVFTHTCYPYEGKNRYILQLATSPYKVAQAVARKYHIFNNIQDLCKRFNVCD